MAQELGTRDALIQAGETAPSFTLHDRNREDWSLADALAKGPVVLCFFPFAFTGVCTEEMTCITGEMAKWQDKGATVVGISCDSFASLGAWADASGIKHTMLSDLHREVCKAYGLYWADMNVSQRGTIVINQDGTVAWSQAREPGNAMSFDEVLNAVG